MPEHEEPRLRRRNRLRDREALALRERLAASLGGATLWDDKAAVEEAEFQERRILVVDNQTVGLWDGEEPVLSVRGLLLYRPAMRAVTVDMGAVRFVANGADIMAPGIVEADPAIAEGAWCWVRDERNRQPLAVGRALVPGGGMVRGKGKAVKSLHHIGDKLWAVGEPAS
ncbi:MAG TPA: PUA domain-containing protein [Candidatus Thermoplasmatota archaeon]|nr:PUA domain-containing protein [Candidatus Thermoplasmatota archaeon]